MNRLILLVCCLAVVCLGESAARGISPSMMDRAQRATVLLDVNSGEGRAFGSAFCISDDGLFVTDGHVVEGATGEIKAVIRPGEKDQRIAIAHVLGINYSADLAVIQLENAGSVPKLAMGNSEAVTLTQQVSAFGYPFGNMLALDKDSYPSITVNTGKITALRKEKGELGLIQIDALVNPGNSGGPVLDDEGRVIGIVESGVPGAGLNFATPQGRLKKMLEQPLVLIDPVAIAYAQRNKKRTFSIHVNSLTHAAANYDVDFKITDPKGAVETVSGTVANGKGDVLIAPTTDAAAIKWNPFAEPPPMFKFVLTLKLSGKVVSTEEGEIYLTDIPLGDGTVVSNGPHRQRGAAAARSKDWPRESPLDPLPATAEDTPLVGIEKSTEFREMAPANQLPTGIEYVDAVAGGNPVIGNMRLLYKKTPADNGKTVVAKDGYVVGGMIVSLNQNSSGKYVVAFKVIFVRQSKGHLDASDTYTSDWSGQPGKSKPQQIAGNGERVIGIHGRRGADLRAVGLVVEKGTGKPATQPAGK